MASYQYGTILVQPAGNASTEFLYGGASGLATLDANTNVPAAQLGNAGLLARTQYSPSSAHTYSLVAAATGLTALDSTNLSVTFTAPASGNVVVRLTGFVQGPAAAGTSTVFGITSTTASPGTVVGVLGLANLSPTGTAADNGTVCSVVQLVTGLTAYSANTWYFAAMYSGTQSSVIAQGTTSQTTVPTGAPAVIEVWAA